MWRAFFFAVGTMLVILGVECLMIDSATIVSTTTERVQPTSTAWFQEPAQLVQIKKDKVVKPPEWVPWSLLAGGSVVILYALTLRPRSGE